MAKDQKPKLSNNRTDNSKPKGMFAEAVFKFDGQEMKVYGKVDVNNLRPAEILEAIKEIQANLDKQKQNALKLLGV